MRFCQKNFAFLSVMFIALTMAACSGGPKYPACSTDNDCRKDSSGNAVSEYCVNKQCQQCRDDNDCTAEGQSCQNGRCETPIGWCKTDGDCSKGSLCQDNQCTAVDECAADEDCPAGQTCQDGSCAAPGCVSDQECGAGLQCIDGECAAGGDRVSAECRPTAGEGVIGLLSVQFDFNEDSLTVKSRENLDRNAECLRQAPSVSVTVEGHADERGTQEYNLSLGERRAKAVINHLRNLGIDGNRLRSVSKGENEPLCRTNSESCHARNRRVEFIQKKGRS